MKNDYLSALDRDTAVAAGAMLVANTVLIELIGALILAQLPEPVAKIIVEAVEREMGPTAPGPAEHADVDATRRRAAATSAMVSRIMEGALKRAAVIRDNRIASPGGT